MNDVDSAEIIRNNCRSLEPLPTNADTKLDKLLGIRAVLFDIYGTLLISASGDIGANAGDHRMAMLRNTCELFELELKHSSEAALQHFAAEIAKAHVAAKAQGIEFPEVDIVGIWQAALPQIATGNLVGLDYARYALEYEVRVNPVWPMPGLETILTQVTAAGPVLGIVSNAQFFTPLLFPALLGKSLEQLGFLPELSYFSYAYRQAKPGTFLYELAQQELESQGITAAEVLYVGNDMLNDVTAAAQVGFRTALFAGDGRSLRWRAEDARVDGIVPDLIVTELQQLADCLELTTS